jgi:hypothetical protein
MRHGYYLAHPINPYATGMLSHRWPVRARIVVAHHFLAHHSWPTTRGVPFFCVPRVLTIPSAKTWTTHARGAPHLGAPRVSGRFCSTPPISFSILKKNKRKWWKFKKLKILGDGHMFCYLVVRKIDSSKFSTILLRFLSTLLLILSLISCSG